MPAVVVDSSVLITLAAGGQFHLLRELYTTLYLPPEVWNEVTSVAKPYGTHETRQARDAGWLMIRTPASLAAVHALAFNLQPGETEALALAVELGHALLLVDDAQGRRAARALGIDYTGTLGVLLRAKGEGKLTALSPVLALMRQRTTFWLSEEVQRAALVQAGEAGDST
jgi:predicted nucleic acid-binding protein